MNAARILIVEDNADILANLYDYLEPLGYTVDSARDGVAGLMFAANNKYDVIILDVMLPGIDGIEVCTRLRRDLPSDTSILMLTARDTVDDKVAGLLAGADDYLVKPFFLAEVDARLQALVRRTRRQVDAAVLRVGSLAFDQQTYEVVREHKPITLSPMGYRILAILMRAAPALVTRETLEQDLWGEKRPSTDPLRTHIHALRQAVDKPFARPMLITIPSIGYRLRDPDAA